MLRRSRPQPGAWHWPTGLTSWTSFVLLITILICIKGWLFAGYLMGLTPCKTLIPGKAALSSWSSLWMISNGYYCFSVMSYSLWPDGLQHTRLPCPSLFPSICSNSHPLSWWYHPTILTSVIAFSFCLQSFPASRSFPLSWLFTSGGQSIGASAMVIAANFIFRRIWWERKPVPLN